MSTPISDNAIYNLKIRKFFRNNPEKSADYGDKCENRNLLVRVENDGQTLNFYSQASTALLWSFDSSHPDFKSFYVEQGVRSQRRDFAGNIITDQEPDWIIIDLLR